LLNAEYPLIRADPQLEQRIKLGREFPDPANPARARSQFQQQRPGSRRPEPTGAKPGTRGVKKAKGAERRSMCTIRSRSRALTAQARRDSSLLLALLLRLPSLDPARGGAVAESGDGDGWTCCCCCFWRTQRATARSREDGARGGRAGLLLTRARCEMIGLARQRRRGPAQRGAAGAPSDGGDGRRMEAAWLSSIIPRAPGQIKIHYCSPASRRNSPPRGSRLLPRALRSPGSLIPL